MATSKDAPTDVLNIADKITVYRDIGVDTDGRAHLYDPKREEIVVCHDDVRGTRIENSDVAERIDTGGKSPAQYARYVTDHVDDVEWDELDILVA